MKQNYLIQLTPEELGVIIKEALVASMGQFIENINLNKKDKLLNREQVANILGKSVSTIDNYKRNGLLPFTKIGSAVYFKESDVLSSLIPIKY
ncbi:MULTISPECIES: helix-turn-helix domain-containing protein [unclassified Empedobacter]|uniref:helix-turn-helix domain-containing protein n=1 Tax=unclassified Empedobacter TaxID=2643773 RepID=UPI0025C49865|nr:MULTISPECIES: helix-turn-helix domain-containing protein [unclassified Empedobacter]